MCNAKGEVVLDCWTEYSHAALENVANRTDQLNFRMQSILKGLQISILVEIFA